MQSSYSQVPQEADENYDRGFQRNYQDDDGIDSASYGYNYNNYRPPSGGVKTKIEHKFYHTKQAVIQKLGKDQDAYVVAGDAEVDARLAAFKHIQATCIDLLKAIEIYQNRIFALSQDENEMGRFLREQGAADKSKAGKMMIAVGKAQSYTAQQRLSLRTPLVRLYQEIETFRYRAISDTALTIGRMEGSRTDYRASLLWMSDISKELDPEEWKRLDKFREVQSQVKRTKKKFEKNKFDVMQKVDLLSASRCNLLSSTLAAYQQAMLKFWENTSKSMNQVAEQFKGYPSYQFQMLKSLNPLVTDNEKNDEIKEVHLDQETHVDKKDTENAGEATEAKRSNDDDDDDDTLICLDNSPTDDKPLHLGNGTAESNGDKLVETDLLGDMTVEGIAARKKDEGPSPYIDLLGGGDDEEVPFRHGSGSKSASDDLLGGFDDHSSDPPSYDIAKDLLALQGLGRPNQDGKEGQLNQPGPMSADDLLFGSPTREPMNQNDLDLLSDIMGGSNSQQPSDSFSSQWQDMFGDSPAPQGGAAVDPSGFMPSDLMDSLLGMDSMGGAAAGAHSSSSTMSSALFAAKPASMQASVPPEKSAECLPSKGKNNKPGKGKKTDMSAWFNLFSDLDPLANPDAIGQGKKQTEEERTC
ncbi:islet cell autoantigen 1 [Nematostella vectensis]|uniref:islet cell autoantigen 1 n=1 Tax=Nematostella vectensis TaxID=45351 RepID=UPI00207787D7|nr:islet cell autoantigen 1 [Nematostella vectensis]